MPKFKVGDKVRILPPHENAGCIGVIDAWEMNGKIGIEGPGNTLKFKDYNCAYPNVLKLIKGEQTMGRRTFRMVKETPTLNKGTLVQEMCDNGDQNYISLTEGRFERKQEFNRDVVETQPKWFEEVFPLVPEYGNKAELEAFKKFSKRRK